MDSSRAAAARRGYPDYEVRIPDGWRVVHTDAWPINTTFGPEKDLNIDTLMFETYGGAGRGLALSYEEFNHFPQSTIIADHHCSDEWSYLGHEWTGVTLKEIAKRTAASESDRFILIECDRRLTPCFPIRQDVLFATKRNGSPVLREGGFPLRAVAPEGIRVQERKVGQQGQVHAGKRT